MVTLRNEETGLGWCWREAEWHQDGQESKRAGFRGAEFLEEIVVQILMFNVVGGLSVCSGVSLRFGSGRNGEQQVGGLGESERRFGFPGTGCLSSCWRSGHFLRQEKRA